MGRNWYQPDSFDAKDKPYIYNGPPKDRNDLISVSLLASDDSLKRYVTPTEITVLDAVCAAFRFLAFSGDNDQLVTEPSRRFIYYNARALAKMDDAGNHTQWPRRVYNRPLGIREALRAVNLYGASLESRFPWVVEEDFDYRFDVSWAINERPPDIIYDEASHGPILEPYRLDNYPSKEVDMLEDHELAILGTLTLSKVRLCIAEGYPVIFAFHLFWDSFRFIKAAQSGDQGYPTIEMIPVARRLAGPQTEHTTQAALIVAFDHIKRRVLVQSMMESISFFWMPYEWIINFRATESFWMLRNSGIRGQGRPVMEKPSNERWEKWEKDFGWTLDRVPESSAVSQAPNSSIAVISRREGHLDVFWVSEQCTVERAYRYPSDKDWKREGLPIKKEEIPLPGAIVAVSAHENKLDVFWMTKNGAICNGSWQHDEPKWYTRRILQEQDGIAEPRAGLAATIGRRNTDFEDIINVYCVGPDGSIKNISTTRSWGGTDTATLLSGPGTAYRCSDLSAVVDSDHAGVDKSTRLMEVVVWIAPDGSIDGKVIAKSNQWVDIWSAKGQANAARLSSHISAVHYGPQRNRLLNVYYAAPDGKLAKDEAIISAVGDYTGGKVGHSNWNLTTKKHLMARPDSDIKAIGWKDDGKWIEVVMWQDEDSELFWWYWKSSPSQVFDSNGVRRGSPFGLAIYGERPVRAMKLDDGLIGVAYRGAAGSHSN